MLQSVQSYLTLFQVYTCATKLLEIARAFRCMCVFFFSSLHLNLHQKVPCLALPNSILDDFSDFKFSTQLVSTVVVAAITVFQVRF